MNNSRLPNNQNIKTNKASSSNTAGLKNMIANIITCTRIPLSIALVLLQPFSIAFWIVYAVAGLSDLLDGKIARKLNQQSAAGAKLDSIADTAFAVAIAVVVARYINVPTWTWICAACIALLRLVGYGVGFFKFHTFASLHTYANKLTGGVIFVFPLLYTLVGFTAAATIASAVAAISSLEELIIIITSKTLNRDTKGIFIKDSSPEYPSIK